MSNLLKYPSSPGPVEDGEDWLAELLIRTIEQGSEPDDIDDRGRHRGRRINEEIFYSAAIARLVDSRDDVSALSVGSSCTDDTFRTEIAVEVARLPKPTAFRRLFWELLEFDHADDELNSIPVPQGFGKLVVQASRDDFKIITAVSYLDDLAEQTPAIRQLGKEIGRRYGESLFIASKDGTSGALFCLCSGASEPRLLPVHDAQTVDKAIELLLPLGPEGSGFGATITAANVDKAISDLGTDWELKRWLHDSLPISDSWLTHQVAASKILDHDIQIDLFRKLAILWPWEARREDLVPKQPEALQVYQSLLKGNLRLAA